MIDLAVLKNTSFQHEIRAIHNLSSDHFPVLLLIGDPSTNYPDTLTRKKTNWQKYHNFLLQNSSPCPIIENRHHIAQAINKLGNDIKRALNHSIETHTSSIESPYNIPARVNDLIRNKRGTRKSAALTKDPADIARANVLQQQVKMALNQIRNDKWSKKLEAIKHDKDSFWKVSRVFLMKRTNIPTLQSTTKMVFTDEDKATAFPHM